MPKTLTRELIFAQPLNEQGFLIDGEVRAESVLYPGEFWTVSELSDGEWEIDCTYKPILSCLYAKTGTIGQCCAWIVDAEAKREEEMKLERHFQAKWDRY